jgi:membrane protease YdiL (CAAX protease family)
MSEPDFPDAIPAAPDVLEPSLRERCAAGVEVVLCSGVPTQTLILALMTLAGMGAAAIDGTPTLRFVSTLLLTDTVVLVGLMVALMRLHGESPRMLWMGTRSPAREAGLGVFLVPVLFLAVVVMLNVLRLTVPWLHNKPVNPLEQIATGSPFDAVLFGVVGILAGGVREELQRAFVLRRFERYLGGPTIALAVTSTAFGLGHLMQGWDAALTTGALGLFWGVIYLRRRSSIAPLVSHAGFNALEILRVAVGLGA